MRTRWRAEEEALQDKVDPSGQVHQYAWDSVATPI